MNIELGTRIGEPVALYCKYQSNIWNGIFKLHLKNPATDGRRLLQGVRLFILILNEGFPHLEKVCEAYDALAFSHLLLAKISGPNLANIKACELHLEIVRDSFSRGFEFEVTRIEKKVLHEFAWVKTLSPVQAAKVKDFKVSLYNEIFVSVLATRKWTRMKLQGRIV